MAILKYIWRLNPMEYSKSTKKLVGEAHKSTQDYRI